ncbi:MAG: hypothetical protein IPM39_19420 [Chloroflexi bacterium]|nr:hypothetical protein [Chloroflexota bacterium]
MWSPNGVAWKSNMSLMDALQEEWRTRAIMQQQFPMLTTSGISDSDVTIHSHFLSYLAALSQPLGYSGVVECPLISLGDKTWAQLGDVRPDMVWFDKGRNLPVAAFEFERFETQREAKLREKVENLVIAYWQSQQRLTAAVLIYWARSGVSSKMIRETTFGYRTDFVRSGVRVTAVSCPLYIFKCTWRSVAGGLVVSDILLVQSP